MNKAEKVTISIGKEKIDVPGAKFDVMDLSGVVRVSARQAEQRVIENIRSLVERKIRARAKELFSKEIDEIVEDHILNRKAEILESLKEKLDGKNDGYDYWD